MTGLADVVGPLIDAVPVVIESADDLLPETLEQMRSIFARWMRGETQEEIAAALSISRSTVARRLDEYRERYRKQLAATPKLHILAEYLERYKSDEKEYLRLASEATADRAKVEYMRIALKCRRDAVLMLEECCDFKSPEKIMSAIVHEPAADGSGKTYGREPTREERIEHINKMIDTMRIL